VAPSGPPTATIAAGEVLYRVHAASRGARFYGRKDATWRWDDPASGYGVLYLGQTPVGPFAETLLRRPAQRAVLWSEVAKRRLARFRTLRPLQLADLHGPGLGWFGITIADIAAGYDKQTNPVAYETTQAISRRAYRETDLDGIQYRSRFDTDELCIALFERADETIDLMDEGREIERAWVEQELERRGRYLIDL
jgi:hypothetical protein